MCAQTNRGKTLLPIHPTLLITVVCTVYYIVVLFFFFSLFKYWLFILETQSLPTTAVDFDHATCPTQVKTYVTDHSGFHRISTP